MAVFELIITLLFVGAVLAAVARRLNVSLLMRVARSATTPSIGWRKNWTGRS
jgi:hypothetical protein